MKLLTKVKILCGAGAVIAFLGDMVLESGWLIVLGVAMIVAPLVYCIKNPTKLSDKK